MNFEEGKTLKRLLSESLPKSIPKKRRTDSISSDFTLSEYIDIYDSLIADDGDVGPRPFFHPPCCPKDCDIRHHPLLLALLNCRATSESFARNQLLIESYIREVSSLKGGLMSVTESLKDPLPYYRMSLLRWAVCLGRASIARWLVKTYKTCTMMERNRYSQGVLHSALAFLPKTCPKNPIGTFTKLMQVSTEPLLIQDMNGDTPLHICAKMMTRGSSRSAFYKDCLNEIFDFFIRNANLATLRSLVEPKNRAGMRCVDILTSTPIILKETVHITSQLGVNQGNDSVVNESSTTASKTSNSHDIGKQTSSDKMEVSDENESPSTSSKNDHCADNEGARSGTKMDDFEDTNKQRSPTESDSSDSDRPNSISKKGEFEHTERIKSPSKTIDTEQTQKSQSQSKKSDIENIILSETADKRNTTNRETHDFKHTAPVKTENLEEEDESPTSPTKNSSDEESFEEDEDKEKYMAGNWLQTVEFLDELRKVYPEPIEFNPNDFPKEDEVVPVTIEPKEEDNTSTSSSKRARSSETAPKTSRNTPPHFLALLGEAVLAETGEDCDTKQRILKQQTEEVLGVKSIQDSVLEALPDFKLPSGVTLNDPEGWQAFRHHVMDCSPETRASFVTSLETLKKATVERETMKEELNSRIEEQITALRQYVARQIILLERVLHAQKELANHQQNAFDDVLKSARRMLENKQQMQEYKDLMSNCVIALNVLRSLMLNPRVGGSKNIKAISSNK